MAAITTRFCSKTKRAEAASCSCVSRGPTCLCLRFGPGFSPPQSLGGKEAEARPEFVRGEGGREGGGGCADQRETTSPRALGAAPEAASCCPQSSLHPQTRGAGAAPRDPYAGTLLVGFFPLPLSTEEKTLLLRVAAETPPGSGCLVWLPSFSVPPGLPAGSSRGRPRGAGGEVGSPTAPDLTT